jgi:hypothetical protein
MRMLSQRRGIHGTRGAPSTADTHRRQARSPARSRRARCLLCAAFSATAGVPSAPVLPRPLRIGRRGACGSCRTSQHATSHLARLVRRATRTRGAQQAAPINCEAPRHRAVAPWGLRATAVGGAPANGRVLQQHVRAAAQPPLLPICCNSAQCDNAAVLNHGAVRCSSAQFHSAATCCSGVQFLPRRNRPC